MSVTDEHRGLWILGTVQLGSRARLVEAGDPSLRLKNGSVRDDAID